MEDKYDLSTEHLPAWMRRARQSVDWGILIALFFSLIAAWPYILYENLPHTNSAENHIYAAADYAQALREGVLYPRWNAAALGGYGAPIYNYTPPGLAYSAGLLDVLFTADNPLLAMRLVIIGAFLSAGALTYVLVLRFSGAVAGILAAVLYIYSPYIGLTAPHMLGDYPALLTFALYPAALWNLTRLLAFRNPFDVVIGAVIWAGFLLVQPQAILVGLVLCGPVLLLGGAHRWASVRDVGRFLIALGAGAGLSAFFWWPAWMEHEFVTWTASALPALDLKLTWAEVLQPVRRLDLSEYIPTPQLRLGWAAILASVGTAGLIIWRWWHLRRALVWHGLYVMVGVILLAVSVTFFKREIWLLTPITLCWAVGGGGLVLWRWELPPQWQRLFLPFAVVVVLVWSLPVWLSVRPAGAFGDTDDYTRILHEQQGFGVAVLPRGAPVPATVEFPYTVNLPLIDGYRAAEPVRVPNIRLTGEKRANFIRATSHADRYLVDAREVVVFDILRAYDAGWRAYLNGQLVELSSNPANGLMQVRVPPVESGQLDIQLGMTPARTQGWWVSGFVAFLLIFRTMTMIFRYSAQEQTDDLIYIPVADARLMGLICAGFLGVVMMYASPFSPVTLHARLGHGLDNYSGLFYRSDVGLEVLAYQVHHPKPTYRAKDTLSFSLAWRTARPLLENYQVRLSLVSEQLGWLWPLMPPQHPAQTPTRRWESDFYLTHRFDISLDRIPPGRYRVAVELIVCEPDCFLESRIAFFGERGQPLGPIFLLPVGVNLQHP